MSQSIAPTSRKMQQKAKFEILSTKTGAWLAGVDILRGLATFGVICIHAGLIVDGQTTTSAQFLQNFFSFVVPFFLITAFYFALRNAPTISVRAWLTKRASRLLLPYVVWSIIYLFLRAVKFVITHQIDRLHTIFQDPIGLLFLNGGGSIALYFLPLLFTGLLLIQFLGKLLQRVPSWDLILAIIFSAGCLHLLLQSGNAYNLDSSQAFHSAFPTINKMPPVRLSLVFAAHTITCLPHIFAAQLAVRHLPLSNTKNTVLLLFGIILFVLPFIWMGAITPWVRPPLDSAVES